VRAVRNIRALTTIGEKKKLPALVIAPGEREHAVLQACRDQARALAVLESLDIQAIGDRPPSSAVGVAAGFEVFVPLGDDVDLGGLAETLERRVDKLTKGVAGVDKKLQNQGFLQGADPEVVEAERTRQTEMKHELELLARNLAGLR